MGCFFFFLEIVKSKSFFLKMGASKRSHSSNCVYSVYSVCNREQILKRARLGVIFMMLPGLLLDFINNSLCSTYPGTKVN